MLITIGNNSSRQPADLVELLLECHQRIRSFILLAQKIGETCLVEAESKDASQKNQTDIVQSCHDCRRYFVEALPLHVQDEEESIFPRLHGRSQSLDDALQKMRSQHHSHEANLGELVAALLALQQDPGSRSLGLRLRQVASKLALDFEEHLGLEEQFIFPEIRNLLSETELKVAQNELRNRRKKP